MKGLMQKKEKGAVTIVEATFVFPIMIFVLFFLLFYGNAWYVKSNVENVVSKYSLEAAAEISDPLLKSIKENGKVSESKVRTQPYRYLTSSYANSVINTYKSKIKDEINITGFLKGMKPNSVKCKGEYKNFVLYQTVRFEVTYEIGVPIRIIFINDPIIMSFSSADEAPIGDSSEFVLNTNMVLDYVEKTGLDEKINKLLENVKGFFG